MSDDATFPTALNPCQRCGARNDRATDFVEHRRQPVRGDMSLCLSCGLLCVFNADLTLHVLTAEEYRALQPSERIELARLEFARQVAHAQRLKPPSAEGKS